MQYVSTIWNILDLLGSIATVLVCLGLLTGKLELRRPRPNAGVRTIVVHEATSASATAAEIARLQGMSGGAA